MLCCVATVPVTGSGSGLMIFMGAPPVAVAFFCGTMDTTEPMTTLRDHALQLRP